MANSRSAGDPALQLQRILPHSFCHFSCLGTCSFRQTGGSLGGVNKMAAASVSAVMVTYQSRSTIIDNILAIAPQGIQFPSVPLHSPEKTKYYPPLDCACAHKPFSQAALLYDPNRLWLLIHYVADCAWMWRGRDIVCDAAKMPIGRTEMHKLVRHGTRHRRCSARKSGQTD